MEWASSRRRSQYQQVNHRPIQLDEQSQSCLRHHRQPTNANGSERYLPVVKRTGR